MKRDFLLGGTKLPTGGAVREAGGDKIADWGGSKGGWGGHVPPSLYVKRGPEPYAIPVRFLPYQSIGDGKLRELEEELENEMKSIDMVTVGMYKRI